MHITLVFVAIILFHHCQIEWQLVYLSFFLDTLADATFDIKESEMIVTKRKMKCMFPLWDYTQTGFWQEVAVNTQHCTSQIRIDKSFISYNIAQISYPFHKTIYFNNYYLKHYFLFQLHFIILIYINMHCISCSMILDLKFSDFTHLKL